MAAFERYSENEFAFLLQILLYKSWESKLQSVATYLSIRFQRTLYLEPWEIECCSTFIWLSSSACHVITKLPTLPQLWRKGFAKVADQKSFAFFKWLVFQEILKTIPCKKLWNYLKVWTILSEIKIWYENWPFFHASFFHPLILSHDKDIADLINHARNKHKTFLFGLLLGTNLAWSHPQRLSCTSGPKFP